MASPMVTPNAISSRAVAHRSLDDLTPHPELISLLGEPAEEEVERLARTFQVGKQPGLLPCGDRRGAAR